MLITGRVGCLPGATSYDVPVSFFSPDMGRAFSRRLVADAIASSISLLRSLRLPPWILGLSFLASTCNYISWSAKLFLGTGWPGICTQD